MSNKIGTVYIVKRTYERFVANSYTAAIKLVKELYPLAYVTGITNKDDNIWRYTDPNPIHPLEETEIYIKHANFYGDSY